ncbi:MAG: glycosyltransferase, partial [Clostridia bacterium]|nr:glycosyltransferase [Clostridia bacterium]
YKMYLGRRYYGAKNVRAAKKDIEKAVSAAYKLHTGRTMNIHPPRTYNEKIQWMKVYDRDERKTRLSDKYAVREWVKETIGEEYLIPLLGHWEKVDDIDFDALPSQFVLKINNSSGENIIVTDKSKLNIRKTKRILKRWMKLNFADVGFEMQYKNIKPVIIAEKYIIEDGMDDLPDYKFFCFDGKVFCSYTMTDYVFDNSKGRLSFFDRDYNLLPYGRADHKRVDAQPPKPENYYKMVELAEKLSEGFSHVRVDFYNINGKIYFGEMTFSTSGGYVEYSPEEFNLILGNQWKDDRF